MKHKPTTEPFRPFHLRLAAARHRAGLLQRDVAAAASMSVQQLSHYETGHNEPGVAVLRRLCVALGCTADELLGLPAGEKEWITWPELHRRAELGVIETRTQTF